MDSRKVDALCGTMTTSTAWMTRGMHIFVPTMILWLTVLKASEATARGPRRGSFYKGHVILFYHRVTQ
jgi:hypothetical protein